MNHYGGVFSFQNVQYFEVYGHTKEKKAAHINFVSFEQAAIAVFLAPEKLPKRMVNDLSDIYFNDFLF